MADGVCIGGTPHPESSAAEGHIPVLRNGVWSCEELPAGGGGGGFQFPIGYILISAVNTNPATFLGYGTWSNTGAGRVLVGIDPSDTDFDTAGEEVGAKTVVAAGSCSVPTFTGSALGTHSHGAGTLATSAHSGAAVADHASHTHTYSEVLNHTHPINVTDPTHNHTQNSHNHTQDAHSHVITSQTATTGGATSYEHGTLDTSSAEAEATETTSPATATNQAATATNIAASTGITCTSSNPAGGVASGTTAGPSATLTHSVMQPSDHTVSGSTQAVSAGTPSGTVSAPNFTGTPTSVVQPSLVVYFWLRVS